MATNYRHPGDVVTLIAPADVLGGQIVVAGALIGVATCDAKAGDEVETGLVGVWRLPKAAGALTQGQLVYWDAAAKNVTGEAGENGAPLLGAVTEAAGATTTTVCVRLNGITS